MTRHDAAGAGRRLPGWGTCAFPLAVHGPRRPGHRHARCAPLGLTATQLTLANRATSEDHAPAPGRGLAGHRVRSPPSCMDQLRLRSGCGMRRLRRVSTHAAGCSQLPQCGGPVRTRALYRIFLPRPALACCTNMQAGGRVLGYVVPMRFTSFGAQSCGRPGCASTPLLFGVSMVSWEDTI
ncbi:hypothetical protein BC834DRAFT_856399 [Gloeopeniophorella convolvens]|nr:hypothetical protein BC834DRAFT_856399 [Gloeopeniophorella convolvens]